MIPVAIFVRVSTQKQDYQRQLSELNAVAAKHRFEVVATITAKVSTRKKASERKDLEELLKLAATGRIEKVLTTEVSRIGRNTLENLQLLEELNKYKVSILSMDMGLETLTPEGRPSMVAEILFTVYSSIYRQEREKLVERIHSGLEEARRQGKTLGRREGSVKSNEVLLKEYAGVVKDLRAGISIRKVAKIHGLTPPTVQKVKNAANSLVRV
jgi:DNA invertase Pin-like site-specific DNA recombinase